MGRLVCTVLKIVKLNIQKRLTLDMVTEAKSQPDYVQEDVRLCNKIKSFHSRLAYNSSFCEVSVRNEYKASRCVCRDWFNTSSRYKSVVSSISFAKVVKTNSALKDPIKLNPLVNTSREQNRLKIRISPGSLYIMAFFYF